MAEPGKRPAVSGWAKSGWATSLLAGIAGLVIGALVVLLYYGFMRPGQAQTEQIVHDYILAHGEVLPEAMERLRARQTAQFLRANRARIETPYRGAWAGAANGDAVLVEYFDYACVYCRASNPHIARLLAEDPRLKVVWREYPVLGPDSEQAAISSLAAADAGRFRAYHDALFATARPTPSAVAAARAAIGLAAAPALSDAYRREIQGNYEIVHQLGASGTPTFVIGDRVLEGAVGYDALKEAIRQARARS
jgi:protein-disulfide isomerase